MDAGIKSSFASNEYILSPPPLYIAKKIITLTETEISLQKRMYVTYVTLTVIMAFDFCDRVHLPTATAGVAWESMSH